MVKRGTLSTGCGGMVNESSLASPEKLSGNNLADYLISHPETTGNISFRQFSSLCWVKLLSHCPQFAAQCDFSKIPADNATKLVIAQPMFLDRFDLTKLYWKEILYVHPDLINRCPEQKLKRFSIGVWGQILHHQPELAKYAPLHRFSNTELCDLISVQPQFADLVKWEKETNPTVWKKAILLQLGCGPVCGPLQGRKNAGKISVRN